MALTKLNLASGVTGTLPTSNYVQGGITEADRWRVTTSFDLDGTLSPIQSNLERNDGTAEGKVGTGMSVSSGIWTFPSTGFWLVDGTFDAYGRTTVPLVRLQIYVTTNNSSYSQVAVAKQGCYAEDAYGTGYTSCLIDVTDTANVKVQFRAITNANTNFECASTNTGLGFGFYRIGDT